ncbi:MAG: heparan N-sulfatase, partial [Bacteroidota bacterium]
LSPGNVYIEKHLMGKNEHNPYWVDWLFTAHKREDVRHLVQNYMVRNQEQLFDLSNDPYELTNLADESALRNIKNELALALDAWMKQQGDVGAKLDSWEMYESVNSN